MFDDKGDLQPKSSRNMLRPETVESLFYMWRVTGEPKYREWGWQIFQAFQRHSRTPEGAYATVEVPLPGIQGSGGSHRCRRPTFCSAQVSSLVQGSCPDAFEPVRWSSLLKPDLCKVVSCSEVNNLLILQDVNEVPVKQSNGMESFWIAETLKYLWLLFGPDELLSLDDWVLNTEAHPLKISLTAS